MTKQMHRVTRRTGAVLAWLLFAACHAYDADLLAPPTAHETVSPSEECRSVDICNGQDDDCDGIIDEDASETCSSQHARERCVFGACELLACDYGYVDCDGDADNGCERLITNAGCEQNLVTVPDAEADAGGA